MSRVAIILLASLLMLTFRMTYNLNKSSLESEEVVTRQYFDQAARNAARSAISGALGKLSQTPSFRGTYAEDERYIEGTGDSVSIVGGAKPGEPITIAATGFSTFDPTAPTHTIIVTTRAYTYPPSYGYALSSGGNLQLHGGITVLADLDSTMNADLHANGNIEISGSGNTIKGFGGYVGEVSGASSSTFQPPTNPSGLPVAARGARVSLPSFNATAYQSKATQTTSGNLTVTDTLHLGTKANPMIWYVSGSVSIRGVISGYGVIVSPTGIAVTGNLVEQTPDPMGESCLGLLTSGSITINAGATADAQLMAKGNIMMNANSVLRGSVVTAGNCEYTGPVTVRYRPSSLSLTSPFWGTGSRVIVESYYE